MELLEHHFDIAMETPDGIQKLRELILSLAMHGKLVPQDSNDQPASELLKEIESEKKKLIKEGKLRKKELLPPIEPDEIPYNVPKSWIWVRLNEFGTWKSGSTPSRNNTSFYGGEIPWVKSGEVKQGRIIKTSETINKTALESCPLEINPKGSVLIAMYGANIGDVGVLEIEATTNQAVCACRTFSSIYNIFLYQLLQSLKNSFIAQGAGAAQPNISREKIINHVVPLPPLAEQKRIVVKIDQLITLCDKLEIERDERSKKRITMHSAAINRLLWVSEKAAFNSSWGFITRNFSELYSVPENVEELKKVILQLAAMGKLVPQDPNDQPASELLKEIEAEKKKLVKEGKIKKPEPLLPIKPKEIPYEVPEGWEWVRLGEILELITDYHANGSYEILKKNVILLDSEDYAIMVRITNLGEKSKQEFKYINRDAYEFLSKSKLFPGDIVMSKITDPGTVYYVPDFNKPMSLAMNLFLLRLNSKVNNLFYYYSLKASKKYIKTFQGGTASQTITKDAVKNLLVSLPPINEQKRIVAKLEQLRELYNNFENQFKDSIEKQTAILNAVLAKA